MIHAILGSKIRQTQQFTENGKRIPVTIISVDSCYITAVHDTPNFKNIQLGFGDTKHLSRAETGHIKKTGLEKKLRFLREVRVETIDESDKPGEQVRVDAVFSVGDPIRITGISKGKGFAGVVKRHGFHGGRETHGSTFHRAPGSIGACAFPSEVWRGQRMPGRLGNNTVTVKNLKIVKVFEDKNIVLISGAVPGRRNSLISVCER